VDVGWLLTSGGADMNIIFLIQSDGSAADVSPSHQWGLLWPWGESWGVDHPVPPDDPWLLKCCSCLTTFSLQRILKESVYQRKGTK